jgi:pimeloyl-ACP methyl ester carboxylesterase
VQQMGTLTSGGSLNFDALYTPILLEVSPTALAFSYDTGSRQVVSQQVSVSSNVSPLSFTATALTSGSDGPWLTVTPSGGATPNLLTVSASPGIKPGSYSGVVSVQSAGAINSPQEISVTLTVASGQAASSGKPIVLLVPGIFGTKLASSSKVVWLSNAVIYDTQLSGPQDLQQLEYDSTGQPVAALSTQAIHEGVDYGGLFNLSSDSGVLEYELVCAPAVRLKFILDPQDCDKDFNVYNSLASTLASNGYKYQVFPYDWRQDISVLAEALSKKVASMQTQYPGRSIAIIAHSMGGLVVGEMFAKHGISPGISHIITMGTPFSGSVHAYLDFRGWDSFYPEIKTADSQAIGANWTSAYELLPQQAFVHLKNGDSPQVISLYDGSYSSQKFPALARSYGAYSALTSAQALWNDEASLSPLPQAYAIIGSGIPTATEVTDRLSSNGCLQYLKGNGDSEVPLQSALGSSWVPEENVGFVKEKHAWLPGNSKVLQAIIQILAGKTPTTLSATPLGVSASVSGCLD